MIQTSNTNDYPDTLGWRAGHVGEDKDDMHILAGSDKRASDLFFAEHPEVEECHVVLCSTAEVPLEDFLSKLDLSKLLIQHIQTLSPTREFPGPMDCCGHDKEARSHLSSQIQSALLEYFRAVGDDLYYVQEVLRYSVFRDAPTGDGGKLGG